VKSAKTRQFIIESTASIFNIKGYSGTSLADLTEATKLTKGSIYGNFANKEEVALAAFDYNYNHVKSKIIAELKNCNTYTEKLLVYAKVYNQSEKNFPKGGCPLLNTAIEADDMHEALRKKVADCITVWKKDIVTIITKGILAEEFKQGTNAENIALTIIALIEGGIMISKVSKNRTYFDIIINQVENLIISIQTKK